MRRWGATTVLALLVSAVSVATPAAGLDVSGRFTDDDGNFHEPQIEAIATAGITLGCGTRLYCPALPVTRAQMASFLVRALGLTPLDTGPFADTVGSPHRQDINAIAAVGITLGCGEGVFCPEVPVSRAQMASFLTRALDLTPLETGPFADTLGSPHRQDINAIAAAGLTQGCAPARFCPDDQVLRDQMGSFLARALSLEPTHPRLPLWEGLATGCTKDGLACWASAVIPYRAGYTISEGFYHVLPYLPGEEAGLADPGTRFELSVDGAPVGLQPGLVDTSDTQATRYFDGLVTMSPGAHTLVGRWFWAGSLVRTSTLELWVAG